MKKEIMQLTDLIKEVYKLKQVIVYDDYLDKLESVANILHLDNDPEIRYIGQGTYSHAYQIGNKVLKIGLAKKKLTKFKHSSIINVYFKDNILIKCFNIDILIGIEVQDLAIIDNSVSDEDLYNVYASLRKDGIFLIDVKIRNVGYYNNKLVVIDTDDLYSNLSECDKCKDIIDSKYAKMYNETRRGDRCG